jgi:hypothetical protein
MTRLRAARSILSVLINQLRLLDQRVARLDLEIARRAKDNEVSRAG